MLSPAPRLCWSVFQVLALLLYYLLFVTSTIAFGTHSRGGLKRCLLKLSDKGSTFFLATRFHGFQFCPVCVCRGNRIRKAVTNIFFDAIKRAVLSPSYMKEAWQKELETIAEDGLTPDEMLVMALEDNSEKMPFFSGCSVYPIFPGAASK